MEMELVFKKARMLVGFQLNTYPKGENFPKITNQHPL